MTPPEQMTPEDWASDPRATSAPAGSILALDVVALARDLFAEDLLAEYSNYELEALALVAGIRAKMMRDKRRQARETD